MKTAFFFTILAGMLIFVSVSAQVSINTDGSAPGNSAMLDVKSTAKGFLPPRMTTAQRNAIDTPDEGLLIFNVTTGCIDYYLGGSWKSLAGATAPVFQCGMKMTDARDGKMYNTVQIGTQCWMAENLNVGTMLDSTIFSSDNGIIEKYCFSDSTENCTEYGALYSWDEIMQYTNTPGAQGICPDGWHIPANPEWSTLIDFLGGGTIAYNKLKEPGTAHWIAPNDGTNESGFTARGSGMGDFYWDFSFWDKKAYTFFRSSTVYDTQSAYAVYLGRDVGSENILISYNFKNYRESVRCVKN